jgi:hypothetical protein
MSEKSEQGIYTVIFCKSTFYKNHGPCNSIKLNLTKLTCKLAATEIGTEILTNCGPAETYNTNLLQNVKHNY